MIPHRRVTRLMLVALALLVTGCQGYKNITPPDDPKINAKVDFSGRHVIIFMVDALGQEEFDELIREGRLPNIKRYLVDRGVVVRPNVTSLTTNTNACFSAALTGRFPGHAGVVAGAWFDRRRLITRRYDTPTFMRYVGKDTAVPFIYEYLGDDYTTAVLTQVNRGVTRFYENYMTVGPGYYFGNYRFVDRATTARFYDVLNESARRGKFPTLTVLYYMSADAIAHESGPASREVEAAFEQIDVHIGEVCKVLARNGKLDRVMLVLISDHGMDAGTPDRVYDPKTELGRLGIETTSRYLSERDGEKKRRKHFDRFRAVYCVTGARTCFLYLRERAGGWQTPCDARTLRNYPVATGFEIDLVKLFAQNPAVDLAAWRESPSVIGIMSAKGEARVTRRDVEGKKLYAYRVVKGRDPLGYADSESTDLRRMLTRGEYSSLRWLAATAPTERPDVATQLPELFDGPRVGDVVLFAAPGWSFATHKKQIGHHGGITRRELSTLLIFAGPGAEHISGGPSRTVDLTPTLLDYLGRRPPRGETWTFDGRSLYRK